MPAHGWGARAGRTSFREHPVDVQECLWRGAHASSHDRSALHSRPSRGGSADPAPADRPPPPLTPAPGPAGIRDRPAGRIPAWWRDASGSLLWLVLLAVTALWVHGGGVQDLAAVGSGLTSLGRLTGLIASALLLAQVFLMARVPLVEQAWGQDRLTRVHRRVGFTSFTLMFAHLALITAGYAWDTPAGLWGTLVDFAVDYPGMLLAIAGTAALVMVVVTSFKAARARLRYESWHLIHLYGYLGAGLALPHQLWTGQEFLASPVATAFWWTLWAVTAGAVVVFRALLPLWCSARAGLRVQSVTAAGPHAVTVTVAGRGAHRLHARGGQFFQWRFLDGPGWTRAHPYSLSAAPDGRTLQFTAAVVGDGTDRLWDMRPGTRVLVEGPYGRMHDGARTGRKALLMGAGIGITPMKALLESLPADAGEITVVHRVSDPDDPTLHADLLAAARTRGARYIRLEGRRRPGADSWLPASAGDVDDVTALRRICPDLAEHDVFVCGAPAWMDLVRRAARRGGVPAERIHDERYSF